MISRPPRLQIANLCFAMILCVACERPSTRSPQEEPGEAKTPALDNPPASVVDTPEELALGQVLEGELAPDQSRTYLINAAAERFLHAVVEQRGIDVAVTLEGPDAQHLLRMDRPIIDYGPEHIFAVTQTDGVHSLRLEAANGPGPSGGYTVRLAQIRPASKTDRDRAEAASSYSAARDLHRQGNYHQATERFRKALAAWEKLGDLSWQGESLVLLGLSYAEMGDWQKATTHYTRATNLLANAGADPVRALAFRFLGLTHLRLMNLEPAIASFREELALRQRGASRRDEALAFHALGHAFQILDDVQQSLDHYAEALRLFEKSADRAPSMHNLGVLYLSMGKMEQARDALVEAEELSALIGDRRRQATTLNQLGELNRRLNELEIAHRYFEKALALRRKINEPRGEANSLANIGRVLQARGAFEGALKHYQESLEILSDLQQPWLSARVLLNLGSLYLDQDKPELALSIFRQSLDLYRTVGDPTGEAEGLLSIARCERLLGRLAEARKASEEALHIFESVRPKAVSHDLRSSFFATIQQHFEFHIDLLAQLHWLERDSGYDALALKISEQARARSLLDLLIESGADIRRGADPTLLARENAIQGQINALERNRLQRYGGIRQQDTEKTIRQLLEELTEVQAKIRLNHPRYATLEHAQVLSSESIQREVLDDETLLLEYWLGEERSYLWTVATDALEMFELPGRETIENQARLTYQRLTQSKWPEAQASTRNALCDLSRMVLAPAIHRLAHERLLVVADGALQFIPFAVLPKPNDADYCPDAEPLIMAHEVISLPSASVLPILRQGSKTRSLTTQSVAVVADPVFTRSDQRVVKSGSTTGDQQTRAIGSDGEIDLSLFQRLHFSGDEADAILALVDPNAGFKAVGFDANKDLITGPLLTNYRFIHLATHGILDTTNPELTGIVLSLVDQQGQQRDGFLRAHEIYNLNLNSDLVVLSACQTALGKEVRGEGLIGLTRGFMYAGAARTMVSLWNISDEGTAHLMKLFYRGLLKEGRRPTAALRAAQISMHESEAQAAPYYWAGFVIQGDWR